MVTIATDNSNDISPTPMASLAKQPLSTTLLEVQLFIEIFIGNVQQTYFYLYDDDECSSIAQFDGIFV